MKKIYHKVLIIAQLILIYCSCEKDELLLPAITTLPITEITYTTAISGGEVVSEGSAAVKIRGICWNTSPKPTVNNYKTTEGSGLGHFVSPITHLMPNKLYYVRAYATSEVGTAYGNEVFFSSNELQVPVLTTSQIASISQKNAISGGNILSENGSPVIERGVCWSTKSEPTIEDNKTVDGLGIGMFTDSLSDLSPSTVYYVRAYAINSAGIGYGNILSFKTLKHCIVYSKTYNYPNAYNTLDGMSVENTKDGGQVIAGHVSINGNGFDLLILKIDSLGNEQWNSVIEMQYGVEFGSIKQITDQGYIVANGARVIKLNQNGQALWMYPLDISCYYNCEYYHCAIETFDDNYIAAGYRDTLIDGVLKTMATLTKFTNDGQVLWQKFYGTNKKTFGRYLCKTVDGNFILLGNTGDDNDYDMNFWVMKFDINGNKIWDKRYIDDREDWAIQIELTLDDGFILSGYSYRERDIVDARILKIDKDGNLQWNKAYFFDAIQNFKTFAYGVEQTKDGGFIFTGGNGYSPEDGLLVKLDQSGEISWKCYYKPDYMDYIWIGYDVKQTNDFGYIITGRKDWVWNGNNKEQGLWLLKTDEYGNFKY